MVKKSAPVTSGDVIQLKISGINHSGEGVGKINGFAIFVPGALPEEQVEVEVTEVKRNYGRAKVNILIQSTSTRREVECSYYQACGGCQLLHLNYEEQLKWKRQLVEETLARIGEIEAKVNPVLGMAEPNFYRNKIQLHVGQAGDGGEGGHRLGYYQGKTRELIPISSCYQWSGSFQPVVDKLTGLLEETNIMLKVKHLVLRVGDNNQVMVLLVTGSKEEGAALKEVPRRLLDSQYEDNGQGRVVSVYHNINPQEGSLVLGREFIHLGGKKQLTISLGELQFLVSPAAFFQINTAQTRVLYDQVKKYAGLTGNQVVLDAYCGTGTIGLYLAAGAKQVVGMEVVADAIEDARQNARQNGINNAEFHQGQVERLLPKMVQQGFHAQIVILDPPRAGCDRQVLEAISRMQPERIVYVSCDPATLARDLKIMAESGYQVMEVQPVDMFPQTSHVECVVLIVQTQE